MRTLLFTALIAVTTFDATAATLTVRITDVRSNEGHIDLLVEASADGWNGKQKEAARVRIKATAGAVLHRFENLPAGDYAVQVMHDENDNGDFDKNLFGMPSEDYGFSRNPKIWRRATFDEAKFDLAPEGSEIVVRLR